jgi:predicted amino acid dehydrogenase
MIRKDVGRALSDILGSAEFESAGYSRERVRSKIDVLVTLLRERFPEFVSPEELKATELFVETAFGRYESDTGPEVETSSVFLVSMRMAEATPEYQNELVPLVPAMHYVPGHLRSLMIMGVPPYVIDSYTVEGGLPGYLVCCPIYGEQGAGRTRHEFIRSARADVQRSIDFATQRLGARLIGLGGVLPSLTRYGQTVQAPGVVVTTGHAGTISLVSSYVERAIEKRVSDRSAATIGVLGLGSIGQSIANTLATRYSNSDHQLLIFDVDERASQRVLAALETEAGAISATASAIDLITQSDIVVSAITSRIDLIEAMAPDAANNKPLAGTVIIDDSQPFAFVPEQVAALGGQLTWVVARSGPNIRRSWYDYASMANPQTDLFGCEAELAVIAAEYGRQIGDGATPDAALELVAPYGVRQAADPEHVAAITMLFQRYGISAAPHQTFAAAEWTEQPNNIIDLTDNAVDDRIDQPNSQEVGSVREQ